MSLPRQFNYHQERVHDLLGSSAPPLCGSVDLRRDSLAQMECVAAENNGSLMSVQSAPAPHEAALPLRPATLLVDVPLAAEQCVPAYLSALSPSEQEEDSLLTLSSVTARPLLAASRGLRRDPPAPPGGAKPLPDGSTTLDGGYGWVVVLGAFMVQFWVAGLFKSYGVLYIEIMESFPESSASVASWIPAILSTLCLALAPVSSALCEKYSCRSVVFVGGLFCAGGLALSYFSSSLVHLLLSFGVMTGVGGGLSTTPGIVIVSQYFDKHRALANGICVSGTAAGSFVFPMLIERLVDKFGFHGTILLLGGGMLHVCVAATLYRSPPAPPAPRVASPRAASGATTTTTEDTTLLDIPEAKSENRLERLFHQDMEASLNYKNNQLGEDFQRSNLITEIVHPSLIEVARSTNPMHISDSEEDEGMDVLGSSVVGRVRALRLRPTRSSSLLHSVEDLSTDSTCVYKARGRQLSRSMYIKAPRPVPSRLLQNKLLAELVSKSAVEKHSAQVSKEEAVAAPARPGNKIYNCISRYLDVSLLHSWRFALLCASVALMSCGSPYALYYLPAYTVANGHSKAVAGRLVAISAALDLCGRLGLGWLCDLHLFDRRKAYIVSILVAGVAVLALPSMTSWWGMAIASGSYGLCLGCWFLLVPVLLADAFGTARIASSYGLVRMFQSIAAISVPPSAGLIRDVTGSYEYCFYGMGSCMVLGAVPVLILHLCFKNEDPEDSDD